jgi:uncharacterized protein YggE
MGKSAFIMVVVAAGGLALSGCAGASQGSASESTTNESAAIAATTGPAGSVAPWTEAAGAAGAAVVADTAGSGSAGSSITAQGTGTVSGTPDVVTIVIGVQTQSASAQTALDDNNKRAADVIGVLKESGVAPADLQTSQLSITPSYDDKGQQITGYQVTNMVTAKLRDISTAGAVIDAAGKTACDAVRVQQLTFSIDDESALRTQARADAVKRAQAQAKQMADAAGVQLGAIRSITETPASTPFIPPMAFAAGDTATASVPLEPGSQELSVVIQVVYDIAG